MITHGLSRTTIYVIWQSMRRRCDDPKSTGFEYYGGRGIKVCKRWSKFENFFADMGFPPTRKHTLDRIDNNRDYSPDNCRWATMTEQNSNNSHTVFIEFLGIRKTLKQWADYLNIKYPTLKSRIRRDNWPIDKAFTMPIQKKRRKSHEDI